MLESGRVGQTWRGRWESFCLVTLNWFCQLIEVTALWPGADGGFRLETSAGEIVAQTVVLSSGAYQRPYRPAAAATPASD